MRALMCVFILVALSLQVACTNDKEVTADQVLGDWEVFYAERNGKQTGLVDGARFSINADGMMTTDITGTEVEGPYVFEEGAVHHQTEETLVYRVDFAKADSMGMRVKIRGLDFLLRMSRLTTEQ